MSDASMSRGLQIDMLAAFGAKGDAAYLPLLEEAVRKDVTNHSTGVFVSSSSGITFRVVQAGITR